MGQNESKELKKYEINMTEWIPAHQNTQNNINFKCNPFSKALYMHITTYQCVQQYEVQFADSQDFYSYTKQLEWRIDDRSNKQHIKYIFPVRYFNSICQRDMCSAVFRGLLYAQKITLTLEKIKDYSYSDQLYLYQVCLTGFRILYQKVGCFDIRQNMILINKNGEVKVWMNPNISKQIPYQDINDYQCQRGSENIMVHTIINILQSNVNKDNLPSPTFNDYLVHKYKMDRLQFKLALQQLASYSRIYGIYANQCMRSIKYYYNQDEQKGSEFSSFIKECREDYTHSNRSIRDQQGQSQITYKSNPPFSDAKSNIQFKYLPLSKTPLLQKTTIKSPLPFIPKPKPFRQISSAKIIQSPSITPKTIPLPKTSSLSTPFETYSSFVISPTEKTFQNNHQFNQIDKNPMSKSILVNRNPKNPIGRSLLFGNSVIINGQYIPIESKISQNRMNENEVISNRLKQKPKKVVPEGRVFNIPNRNQKGNIQETKQKCLHTNNQQSKDKSKKYSKTITYHTLYQEYQLSEEIAEDLQKYWNEL